MIRIFITIAVLSGLINGYIAYSILSRWNWAQQHALAFWIADAGFFLLQIAAPLLDRLCHGVQRRRPALRVFSAVSWLAYLALGIFSCLFIYTVAVDIGSCLWRLAAPSVDPAAFDHHMLLLIAGLTLATIALGVAQALYGPVIRRIEIPLRNLPAQFAGFKIAQISDLHVGPTIGRAYAEKVVARVNALKPDLIALTGDLIDGTVALLRDDIAPLASLAAPHGVFSVSGNHEYYWDAAAWAEELRRLGARVLDNEHVLIRRGGQAIVLAGVPDYSTGHSAPGQPGSDPKQALHGAPAGAPKILLAHQPASYRMASEAGYDLQISGHTHAGQYFPFSLLIRFFQRYYKGLNRHGDLWIYVSSGTGYWGPPLRTAVPSEITLITLTALREAPGA